MGKRANNEGSIYKQRSGLWAACLHIGYKDGKRVRQYFYGKTQQEAQKKRDDAKAALAAGQPLKPERATVGEYLDQWLEQIARRNTRPKTFATYRDLVNKHLKPGLGDEPLGKLSVHRVQLFINNRIDAGLSLKTVKHIRDCLRNALNVAANEWNLIPSNPVPKVRLPRIPKREMKFFSLNEAHAFMAATRNHKLEALFQIALMLGMRQGELLGLRWADIDLEKGILQVRSSLLFSGGKFHIAEPKSTKGHRMIPLPEFTRQVLLRHQIEQDRLRMEAGSVWVEWGLVFPTKIGTPRHRRNLLRLYYTLIKSADLPQIRFHDLRHSAAAILISLGASPKYVQEILGHADFATTMNLYGHLFNEVKTEMAAKVDTLFGTPDARSPRSTRQTN